MHKMLNFLIILISGQVLAQNIKGEPLVHNIAGQSITQDLTSPLIIENVTGELISQLIRQDKPLDRKEQQSKIDMNWQSLVKDLNGEPIVQDLGRRIYKNEVSQTEALHSTEQPMHQDVPSDRISHTLAEQLLSQNVTSQPPVQNTTESLLGPNVTRPSQAQSISTQNTIQDQYQNVTGTTGSFGPTLDSKYNSQYLDPYEDSQYKSSMPPIQTQEQWNTTNWHDELSDEEVRQSDEIKQQELHYKRMREEIMNTTTSCEEFLNNTVFDPEKVLHIDWHTIYYWNVRDEDPYNIRFTRPTETMIKRFKDGLHEEIKPPVDWSAAELFLETNVEYNALYVKTNVSGLYRAIPSASFQYYGIPILNYALKIVNDQHLGIVNCKAKQCYALCDMEKLPQVDQIPVIAQSMGFHSLVNHSFVHLVPLDENDPDDLDESLEDNMLGDYDTLNIDPLKLDIF